VHRLQDEVRTIVAREGLILRRDHPELRGAVERLLRTGELVSVLPGAYSTAAGAARRDVRLLALARHDPDAVLVGRTAAQLTFWPDLKGDEVLAATRAPRARCAGYRFQRRAVPPELVLERGRLRMATPALTALDLHDEVGADGIDRALRTRTATLAGMRRALHLTQNRPGNAARRLLLLDSRDEPWSAAERVCHRLLRDARITGWKANRPVVVEGALYYLDVVFKALRLVVEIDGRLHEDDEDVFENDRWRQNALVLDGWMVVRFTWAMLRDHPEVVLRDIRAAIAVQRRFSYER
jgi:very-short-patch-repair endonuclease